MLLILLMYRQGISRRCRCAHAGRHAADADHCSGQRPTAEFVESEIKRRESIITRWALAGRQSAERAKSRF